MQILLKDIRRVYFAGGVTVEEEVTLLNALAGDIISFLMHKGMIATATLEDEK